MISKVGKFGFCRCVNYNVCLFLYFTEFYGKNNLEATYIDLIFDTFQDLLSKAMPYLNEDDNDKKVI